MPKVKNKIIKKVQEKKAKVAGVPELINEPIKSNKKTPQLVRGFKDILPSEQKYFRFIGNRLESLAQDYGFEKIDPPILEETSLFSRAVGKETDIVSKEMFSFETPGGERVSLRPEATASVVRAYINHGMLNLPQPVKLYYTGPMFRYERPQSGRYRQFSQFGFEILGDKHPVLDAQLIILANNFFQEIGLKTSVQINSIGCAVCRKEYKTQLVNYYKTQKANLCVDCKERLYKNPLRLLDCKEEKCSIIKEEAPQIVDWLCDECKNHFVKVLEFLDEVQLPYNLNPSLVRGLDYYTNTVFEIWPEGEEKKSQSALCGGGRYDNLIELLGGRPTPALGVSVGIERTILKLKELNIEIPDREKRDIFVAQLGEAARKKCLPLYESLRKEGIRVAENFSKDGLKAQLEIAGKLGVRYSLILGQKELSEGTILLRDMEAGVQETLNFNKVIKEVKKRLENQ
ncbi:MAG: histidine--tRNA ligase [Patescibacteria group bacterium]|nr:histidine--tRNA ligase [Patescibacteria group bacterium]